VFWKEFFFITSQFIISGFLIITDNPALYMFRRRKTGEGINYAGDKKIEEEKYCIFLLLLVR